MKSMGKGLFLVVAICLFGCQAKPHEDLRVGVISGPEAELMQVAAKVAGERGVKVTVVEFNDYTIPNTALAEGSLDANMFQHQPYLVEAIQKRNYPIEAIGKTYIYPMGLYSKKIKTLEDLQRGSVIGIPNDPTNEARALRLLEKAKLIKLKDGKETELTVKSITENSKALKIKEMDAAELPRALEDLSLAAINTNYAVSAGLMPTSDALYLESKDSPYANLLVVKITEKNDPRFKVLIEALHSSEVQEEAKKLFHGQAIQAW